MNDYYVTLSHKNREVMLRPDATQVRPRRTAKAVKAVNDHIVRNRRTYIVATAVVGAGIIVLTLILYTLANIFPYAITVNGENVCYVRGKAGVQHTYRAIIKNYIPEDTELKAVNLGDNVSYERVDITIVRGEQIVSAHKAAKMMAAVFEDEENPINIRIASTSTELSKYTPLPKYVKGKDLIVGETKVKKKGKDGKQEVVTTYITENGKIISKSVTARHIVDEGIPSVVYKGILGLPDGEDWKTYDGDPVYKNGKELVKTAMKYRGAPYKYGGYSLTKGIDCVQFVRQMYAKYGISLPNSHYGLQHSGVGVKYKNAKKGDIICYGNHVGIYIGNGKMVNAVKRGVSVSKVKTGKIKAVRRVVK